MAITKSKYNYKFAAAGDKINAGTKVKVAKIVWAGCSTDAHDLSVIDGDGVDIWTTKGAANANPTLQLKGEVPDAKRTFNGLEVDVLDSGVVYVWTD